MWGITYKSIRSIISSSKLAVIYCNPEVSLFLLQVQKLPCFAIQTLKIVHHSSEFLPYVIFLSPPSTACIKQLECCPHCSIRININRQLFIFLKSLCHKVSISLGKVSAKYGRGKQKNLGEIPTIFCPRNSCGRFGGLLLDYNGGRC